MDQPMGTLQARHAAITRVLAEQGRIDVAETAELLGVVPETVRRDLRALERSGVLRRVHGGAISSAAESCVPIPTLAEPAADEAAAAAAVWSGLPRTGTVLIGSGPLALALTHALIAAPPAQAGLTVVTNSVNTAVHLARLPLLSVYNIGGTVSYPTGAQEGDWALDELRRLRVDVAVLSPAGISVRHGLSESTPSAAAVAQAIVSCSERRLVVCTGQALGHSSFVQFARLDEIDHLFVAGRPDGAAARSLLDQGVPMTVLTASPHAGPADLRPVAQTHSIG